MEICEIRHFGLDVSTVKVRSFDHLLTHCFDRLDLLIVSLHLGKDVVDLLEVDEDTVLVVLYVLDLKNGLLLFNPFYHLQQGQDQIQGAKVSPHLRIRQGCNSIVHC